ncbi:RRXRR domain-containing protein [Janthinobacterium aquaticum]|uniref:RRXRR domain-containing protein n=1 Tax=Janthinobacterium sp. FT58W TaxID=2654254 RepID=UPI00186B0B0C|nr:RRXRR domain-containing protein [Janthinobacterium sp. FT58W]
MLLPSVMPCSARAAARRWRRHNLRYRTQQFNNRSRPTDWQQPSIDMTMACVSRLSRMATVAHLAQELVCIDMQLLQNPDISGVGYPQGMLADYEVHEYLHGKFGHTFTYCDTTVVPLQMEHIHARRRRLEPCEQPDTSVQTLLR